MHSYNQYIFSRERRRFGRQTLFSDRTALMFSVYPSRKNRLSYIRKNPIDRTTQLGDQKAFSIVETENVTHTEHGMYHYEGGWPKELNILDEEQTQRHRKKIEREDNWGAQVPSLIHTAMELTLQNAAVNIYENFFDVVLNDCGAIRATFSSRQMSIFHDEVQPPRRIFDIDWSPADMDLFLVQHTRIQQWENLTEENAGNKIENVYYIWDMKNSLKPLKTMECGEQILAALYCPKDDNYIAGGLRSGAVAVWDSRTGGPPKQITPLELAHRETTSGICWVHSKTNTEFYTGSYDGSIKFWDGRNMKKSFTEVLLDPDFTDNQSRQRAQGVTQLEFEYTIPVRFIATSDMGHIFVGNRKGVTPSEILLANYKVFSGPIHTIQRNPFFVKNFLITGDWCAKIWAEECKGAPTTLLVKRKHQILCGAWSTTRCSLFVTGDSAGNLDFWDVLLSQREPIFNFKYSCAISDVKFRPDGEYLAVALYNGDLHMMEMDDAVKRSGSKDKATMAADGENVSKLEKADILELTVRHLQRLREHDVLFLHNTSTMNMEKFWAGFQLCAAEVSQFMHKYDREVCGEIVNHIASYIPNMVMAAGAVATSSNQRRSTAVKHIEPAFPISVTELSTIATAPLNMCALTGVPGTAQTACLQPHESPADGDIVWRPW